MADVSLTGVGGQNLRTALATHFAVKAPSALAVASAFVSVGGIEEATKLLRECGARHVRLLAGLSHCVTHPEALAAAKSVGWELKLWTTDVPLFHPKVMIASQGAGRRGRIIGPLAAYIGSANLTESGFRSNIECGALVGDAVTLARTASVFQRLWQGAADSDERLLRIYADKFAAINRRRSPSELVALGVADGPRFAPRFVRQIRRVAVRPEPVMGTAPAVVAWAGLESFTGEYRFQIEFPRAAGEVVRQIAGLKRAGGGTIAVLSVDGSVHEMQYRFYEDNSMFRLNVPNEVPGVDWARRHHRGVAVVEKWSGNAAVKLTLLRPGPAANDVIGRSIALGTWGRTPTRLYGWY